MSQSPSSSSTSYEPGACNIGPAEVARRRRAGHGDIAACAVLITALAAVGAESEWYLLVSFPATAAAAGYLQARARFCANYGIRGIYAMGRAGQAASLDSAVDRRADVRHAWTIIARAAAIGAAAGVTVWALAQLVLRG